MEYTDGKYDRECEELLRQLHAGAVVLIVVDGQKGHGFSVAIAGNSGEEERERVSRFADQLPELMRRLADLIDQEAGPPQFKVSKY